MTQRQKRYWRAWYKVSNYTAILEAVNGPKFTLERVDIRPNYVEGITLYLEDKAHEMYLSLKSLGAIATAQKLKDSSKLSDYDLQAIIALAKKEIVNNRDLGETSEATDPSVVEEEVDVND